ncbi:MAG: ATPase, partial [Lachnospiraceae bacterium]|nr:ATPase [Lachnospiraceae bacterium]
SVWKEYAKQAEIHPAIISYLTAKPQYFYQVETTVDGRRFATPRGWEDLSRFLEVYEKINLPCDREVVSQYIQHAKIAKDFANYLELYYKYQSQYQIDEVLLGNRNERLMELAAKASFDEKISVIGLLLAKLNVEFGKAGNQEAYLEMLFGKLKAYKGMLQADASCLESRETAEGKSPLELFTGLSDGLQAELDQKKKAGLLTRREQYRYRDVSDTMNRYFQTAKAEQMTDGEEIFARFAGMFGEERKQYEEQCDKALQMLEYAFDFMEGTYGDSQEMVIFITELNTSQNAVKFLADNSCDRYYQYNKRLLFEDRSADIMKKLDRLGSF